MNRTPTHINEKRKSSLLLKDNISRLSRDFEPDELSLIRQRQFEKKELSEAANLVRDFVNVLKEGMKNNYDESNSTLPRISLNQLNKKRASQDNMLLYRFVPKKTMGDLKRKSFDASFHLSPRKSKNNDYKKRFMKKISVRNYNPNRLSLNSIDDNRYSLRHRHSYGGNEIFNFQKKKTQEMHVDISSPEYESEGDDDENIKKILNSSPKLKSALKNNESEKKKKVEFHNSNIMINNRLSIGSSTSSGLSYNKLKSFKSLGTSKNSFILDDFSLITDDDNGALIHQSQISSENILKLKDLKKEIKNSFIGRDIKIPRLNEGKNYLYDDLINNSKNGNEIDNGEEEEEIDITYKEQRYRNLQRKGYVYDSFDDEENYEEEKMNTFFISPESSIIVFFDFLVTVAAVYYLIYIPYFLGSNVYFCSPLSNSQKLFEIFIDVVYFCDLIFPFFIAYYNFDEVLKTHFKDISLNYLTGWFFLDLIQSIPLKTIFTFFDKKCKTDIFYITPLYNDELHYSLLCLRMLKIFKVLTNNKFLDLLSKILNEIEYFSNYLTLYSSLAVFFIAIHIVSNIFIFIGRNEFPNWIISFGYDNKSYLELYLIGIYYTIATLTTVGYGDINCTTPKEKIFGMFMEVVGIFAYSWALTSVGNYVKVLHEKTEEYEKNVQILEEIKLTYPKLSDDLYERISRYLKYKHDKEQLDKNIIIDCLPVNLSNLLVYEMYKPIINNFIFFKNFDNVDFIVKVILNFKPILAEKNDILIKNGDIVEDIIFVKKGKLSLELPLDLNPKMQKNKTIRSATINNPSLMNAPTINNPSLMNTPTINNPSLMNAPTIFRKQTNLENAFTMRRRSSIFDNAQTFFQAQTIKKNFNKYNEEKEKENNIQTFKILEIRKNEQFGDILMFLNQRSPLTLRVKSKKAELFFLNKTDAIDISTSYPSIWQKINVKSLFNYEQIKRLMNKILKIFRNSHGLNNYNPFSKLGNDNNNGLNNSSIYLNELIDEEDELKSIPSLSDNIFENYEYDDETGHIKKTKSLNRIKTKHNSLNTIKEITTIEENDSDEKNVSEKTFDKISEKSQSKEDEDIDSHIELKKVNSNEKNDLINYPTISINSDFRHKSQSINEKGNITPFLPEEINDEIYPDESFVNTPKRYNTNEKEKYLNVSNLRNKILSFINAHNINDNISVCSTESFSINSEYENIDELSDYKYSKDTKLRQKVIHLLKKKDSDDSDSQRISKSYTSSVSIDDISEENDVFYDNESNIKLNIKNGNENMKFNKINMNNLKQRRQSISFFKSLNQNKKNNNNNVLRKTGTTRQDERNLQILNFQNRIQKNNNFIENRQTRKEILNHKTTKTKKNLLRTISKNIERNQINLNNPDLFYSEYFRGILDKRKVEHGEVPLNKEEEEFMNKLEKKSTFSRMNSISNNLTLNYTTTIRDQN